MHVYRVSVNRPVSVLVKANSRHEARQYVSKEITAHRLDTGELLDAIHAGEKVFPAAVGGHREDTDADETDSAGC